MAMRYSYEIPYQSGRKIAYAHTHARTHAHSKINNDSDCELIREIQHHLISIFRRAFIVLH